VQKYAPPAYVGIYERNSMTADVGYPEDIGYMAAFLLSDEARYVTGQNIPCDGGISTVNPILADFRQLG
jgi:NAD(P)-dependent dehydrogenase (short-subunit alcohol dehydrogenase family)